MMSCCGGFFLYFFFFFQAEDGIRDGTVTGVQTCALPICHSNVSDWQAGSPWEHRRVDGSGIADVAGTVLESTPPRRLAMTFRSEERRVGKECRSRWSP